MFFAVQRLWRHREGVLARYFLATALPLAAIFAAVQLAMPAFIFEHLMVLLVVALAIAGGRGPAILAAVVASLGDNILLREPVGRPAIDGFRDVVDFGLFLLVAATVGWLVNRLRAAKEQALVSADRERLAREQRDRLVATVTHDLATPLNAIQGTLQFVRKNASLTTVDLPRLLERIETAAGRATSLVRALQDASSLEEDALSFNVQRTDLRAIVEPTVRMLDRLSDRHPIALMMTDAPLPLDCDVERVGRVIENLVTNAIKYSPDGGPVQICALEEHGFAVLRIEDRGIGIPAVDHQRLFELGYRTDKAAGVASGLGLGLFIAAGIVRGHGGTLEAARRESGGSVFTVRLPLVGSRNASLVGPAPRGSQESPYRYAS